VELLPITLDDLPLYEAVHCDPRMMEHLGGPLPRDGMADKLRLDVATTEAGETWVLKVIPDPTTGVAAGTVSLWDHEVDGQPVTEMGWMILPEFQGRGLGSRAVRAALDRAWVTGRWTVINTYPPVSNPASNAMCRKNGFVFVRERDLEYRGHVLRCNQWTIDLKTSAGEVG
jgi:RimJ/RimL family protein N-acetyltransferase